MGVWLALTLRQLDAELRVCAEGGWGVGLCMQCFALQADVCEFLARTNVLQPN